MTAWRGHNRRPLLRDGRRAMTASDAAEWLGLDPATVTKAIKSGALRSENPHTGIGRKPHWLDPEVVGMWWRTMQHFPADYPVPPMPEEVKRRMEG